jgi:hypothetical protein
MHLRTFVVCMLGGTLLLPVATIAADRGPSTAEERKQALTYIHDWEQNPVGPNAKDEFGWVLKWIAEVPDVSVHVCTILDKLPKGNKKNSDVIFGAAFMAQTAFVIENPDKKDDRAAEYLAGVEGSLNVYAALVKIHPQDRQDYLDNLIKQREAGTLAQFVKERSMTACENRR